MLDGANYTNRIIVPVESWVRIYEPRNSFLISAKISVNYQQNQKEKDAAMKRNATRREKRMTLRARGRRACACMLSLVLAIGLVPSFGIADVAQGEAGVAANVASASDDAANTGAVGMANGTDAPDSQKVAIPESSTAIDAAVIFEGNEPGRLLTKMAKRPAPIRLHPPLAMQLPRRAVAQAQALTQLLRRMTPLLPPTTPKQVRTPLSKVWMRSRCLAWTTTTNTLW